ncbi:MAG: glutamate--tRNA ligase [Bacteriovoracaceae bacterium]|nr:glutamate--tRNA ligase [Bacteriovoracaceae bacterium]
MATPVRVRFAPSPTGYLHIGGARTALFNYLYAKASGGTFVLRIEDTDQERGNAAYEKLQIEDLKWLGINHDEGPDKPGTVGPYHQSERLDIYRQYAQQLIKEGKAYYCFCSDEELEQKRQQAIKENRAPLYDGTCRNLAPAEVERRLAAGEKAVIRFKAPQKEYVIHDHVRGEVRFPPGMVGDFVILRANGYPVYNYCSVIDDWLMGMTHIIRGEEHLPNTLRQLMLYEGFGVQPPEFAHLALLVNKERAKLSKRDGAVSVGQYREDHYLPEALVNYLCLLGWSHPEEKDVFTLDEVIPFFSLDRFVKSSAFYDIEKLKYLNGQHLRRLPLDRLIKEFSPFIPEGHPFHQEGREYQERLINLYKDKIDFASDITPLAEELVQEKVTPAVAVQEILAWDSTKTMRPILQEKLNALAAAGQAWVSSEDFQNWCNEFKTQYKIKGKFLFMGMRGLLTGHEHGPDLAAQITLIPLAILQARVAAGAV